jgi:hypothetical protein
MFSSGNLEIKGSPAAKSVNLKEGWNLVSYPSSKAASVATALSSIAGKYIVIYSYDTSAAAYKGYAPGMLEELSTIEPGKGYWIFATQSATWSLD